MNMELLGHILKVTPAFRGRGRLIRHWVNRPRARTRRTRILPGGATIPCDLAVPYEAMIWLAEEEERDLHVLRALLRPGDVFVDCGANIGLWTLVAAPAVEATGRVLAFEPNPATFASLAANVAANGLAANTRLFPVACGETAGELPFRCDAAHNVSHVVPAPEADTLQVSVVTLDAVLAGQKVDGIKLDVEGFELPALRGAAGILERWRPWLCVEFNTLLAGVQHLGGWPVHRVLTELGYTGWRFHDATGPVAAAALTPSWSTTGYCNVFYQ